MGSHVCKWVILDECMYELLLFSLCTLLATAVVW